jgi:hypothetical protein
MIATAQRIADQRHDNRAASVPRRQNADREAGICLLRLCLSLSLACVLAFMMAGLILSCGQMLAFSSFSPLEVVHGLTASK